MLTSSQWVVTDHLVGSIGIFKQSEPNNITTYLSEITTDIELTSLLGTSDLDGFFDDSHALYSDSTDNTPPWNADIRLAKNKTLDLLIAELSFNTTVSFLSDRLLS
jgi:hypothetical protein